jgi:hypothetical protein
MDVNHRTQTQALSCPRRRSNSRPPACFPRRLELWATGGSAACNCVWVWQLVWQLVLVWRLGVGSPYRARFERQLDGRDDSGEERDVDGLPLAAPQRALPREPRCRRYTLTHVKAKA